MDCWINSLSIYHDLAHAEERNPIEIVPLELNKNPPIENEDDWNQQHLQSPSAATQPDLPGITKMLRMVNPEQITADKLDCITNGEVIISKLNKNAPEFRPRKTKINATDKSIPNFIKTDPNCDISNKLELSTINYIDKIKMQRELLSKIGTTQTTCERTRRQRNAAIAEILKLGALPIENVKPVTPDENKITDIIDTPGKDVINKSIERVDTWLNDAHKMHKKTNSLYLGPITFKKKAKSTESSLSLNTVSSEETKINNFSPTNIASDLTEAYIKRIKQREDVPLDIWSKLERDLKARDEEIRKKSSNSSL